MNAPSVDIAAMLVADTDLGLTIGTNLFVGREPDGKNTADDTVTVFDTGATGPQLTLDGVDSANYEYTAVQIRVRNTDYRTGWALAQDIMTSLHGRAQETVNDTLYSVIYTSSGPALLDWDQNHRARFIVNFNIQRR